MKRLSIFLLVFSISTNSFSQKNGAAGVAVAGAIVGAIAGVAANEEYKELLELKAAEWMLKNTNENEFLLKSVRGEASKSKDQSMLSVFAFNVSSPSGKRVLMALLSSGWVNEFGVDFEKVKWKYLDKKEWNLIIQSYIKKASGKEIDLITISHSDILPRGIRYKGDLIADFQIKDGDFYQIADYSDEFKIVYNEKSFGLYVKETSDLVQLKRTTLNKIHVHLNPSPFRPKTNL